MSTPDPRLVELARELAAALCMALPYVEEAESDPAYKPGVVARVTRQIRAVLAKAAPLG